ncbi:glycosyltransferase family 9 protein [Thermonema sp.]|uniref:glycosyltransferase family 9 protein n=1 Tax=Thermonema sp. TaxID=2231181 RepID=UPI0025890AEB|nr:glycosyltransferase family 9 protein [Thermonema sp.]
MRLLVVRFSAMGDVALLLPVLVSVLRRHPDVQIDVLTRPKLASLFEGIERLRPVPADVDGEYKGIGGLWRLGKHLQIRQYDYFIDAHQNLRSNVLKAIAHLQGVRCLSISKNRKLRKRFIRERAAFALPHVTDMYATPFRQLGLDTDLLPPPYLIPSAEDEQAIDNFLTSVALLPKSSPWMGIAPFAFHENKQWGVHKVEALLRLIKERHPEWHVFLFGGGKKEAALMDALCALHPGRAINMAGCLSLRREWLLMHRLDAMLSMDSANMHLAALAGIPVVSVWGATHPHAGFAPLFQPAENMIQRDDLDCRPCSIFGSKPCVRGDKACMERIEAAQVMARLEKVVLSV